ncbi:MAG: two-component system response regulator PilR (NtrC family) [Cellvibrionaceae bacterium]|jgi:two-component system response regulator PilR (NtrC family)
MSTKKNVLIIDDEPDIRGLLSMTLERMGHNTVCAANLEDSKKQLNEKSFDLCLTDLKLPDGSGIDIVKSIHKNYPETPVIVITAHGSMDIAIEAMKYGAFDFINKPVELSDLRRLITNALSLNDESLSEDSLNDIIGASPLTVKLKQNIAKVSRSQAPVFIQGESGSGKELVARAIHNTSTRHNKPFVAVNCGAIPRELMESEFFGHVKGSFTGAHQDKQGLFQSAAGGTLFLDEVADLPMDMQVKLLRAIQEKTVRPVGSHKELIIDVRILSATHKNLLIAIDDGTFRNDLYYRINVIEINVPSLRQRKTDITLLTTTLLERIAEKNTSSIASISKSALNALEAYDFPGNIRELENILERACALCADNKIDAEDLQLDRKSVGADRYKPIAKTDNNHSQTRRITDPTDTKKESLFDPSNHSLDHYLENIEKDIILYYLEQNRWNRTNTAKVLGITFRSLRYRLKKLGIDDE